MLLRIALVLLLLTFADESWIDSTLFWVENIAIFALTLLMLCSSCRSNWSLELDFPFREDLFELVFRSTLPFELEEDLRLNSKEDEDVF